VREVEEEAGCRAAVVTLVGFIEFNSVRVAFFLMHYERDVPPDEDRDLFWGSYEQVLRRLSFEDTRDILTRAHALVSSRT
jgi:8-oxo-dGTP pyrophosphatase MutT (NUDIX family)